MKINELLQKVYNIAQNKKLDIIITFPTIFILYIPLFFLVLGTTIDNNVQNITFSLGECDFFSFQFNISLNWLFGFLGLLSFFVFLSVCILRFYSYRNDPEKRLKIYNYWKKSTYLGIPLIILLYINTLCFNGSMNFFSFDTLSIAFLFVLNLLMIVIPLLVKNEVNTKKNV